MIRPPSIPVIYSRLRLRPVFWPLDLSVSQVPSRSLHTLCDGGTNAPPGSPTQRPLLVAAPQRCLVFSRAAPSSPRRQRSVSLQKTALLRLVVFELASGCVRIRCEIGEQLNKLVRLSNEKSVRSKSPHGPHCSPLCIGWANNRTDREVSAQEWSRLMELPKVALDQRVRHDYICRSPRRMQNAC